MSSASSNGVPNLKKIVEAIDILATEISYIENIPAVAIGKQILERLDRQDARFDQIAAQLDAIDNLFDRINSKLRNL